MNNLSSYYGLTDSRMSAAEKDLHVLDFSKKFQNRFVKDQVKVDRSNVPTLHDIFHNLTIIRL